MDASLLVALVVVSIAAGAIAQSVTGAGFSLVAAPALLAYLGPGEGVSVVVILAALSSVLPLCTSYSSVRYKDAGILLIPIVCATPVIALVVAGFDTQLVAAAAGVCVVIGVILLARGASWSWFTGLPGAIAAGVSAAVLNVVGGVGGPPLGMFAANAGWDSAQSRATLQFVLLVQNIVTAIVVGIVAPPWWMVLTLVVGTLLGSLVATRMSAKAARNALLVVAGVGGLALALGSI